MQALTTIDPQLCLWITARLAIFCLIFVRIATFYHMGRRMSAGHTLPRPGVEHGRVKYSPVFASHVVTCGGSNHKRIMKDDKNPLRVFQGCSCCSVLVLLPVIFMACSPSFRVSSELPDNARNMAFRSFKFYNPKNVPASNFSFSEENQKILFDAIANELKLKGYTSRQDADLLIRVQGGTRLAQEERGDRMGGMYDPYMMGYPYSRRYYGYPYYPLYDRQYQDISKKETTVIVDVLDARDESLVWQGSGTGVIGKKESEVTEKLREAVHNIMQNFPYSVQE
jgi:hypothetical protein